MGLSAFGNHCRVVDVVFFFFHMAQFVLLSDLEVFVAPVSAPAKPNISAAHVWLGP